MTARISLSGAVALCCLILSPSVGTAAEIMLVQDGQPVVEVVVPAQPLDNELFAAEELSLYLGKMTGLMQPIDFTGMGSNQRFNWRNQTEETLVPVVTAGQESPDKFHFYVGRCRGGQELLDAAGEMAPNEFLIRGRPGEKAINIVGLDVDWDPDSPQGYHGHSHRARFIYEPREGRYWKISFERSRGTMRCVYTFLEDYCGIRWYMPGDLGEVVPEATSITVPDRLDVRRKPDFTTRSLGRYTPTPGGWWGEYNDWMHRVGAGTARDATWSGHTFQGIAKKLRDEGGHPEFFADVGEGKRSNEYLCFTAPGFADYVADYVIEEFEKRNLIDGASGPVMPWDGYRMGRMCQCERCQPYIEMGKKQAEQTAQQREAGLGTYWSMNECGDYVWRLFVKVANILKVKAPQIRATNCAYGSYCLPPQGVTFPDNVGIQICLDWPATESEQQRTLHRIQEYKKRGLEGMSMETAEGSYPQTGQYQAMDHINHYVQIRFLLDAEQDLDEMLNEYYDKFYGPAAATMKRFYERQMRQWDKGLSYREPRVNNYEYVRELMSMLKHARRKVEDDTIYARRLDAVIYDYMPWYTRQKQMAEPDTLEIRTVSEAPVIDGDLSDAMWADKPKVDFSRVGPSWGYFTQPKYPGRGGHEDPNQGWGICVRHGDTLYFALKSGTAKPDSLMKDSYSEVVFASPEGTRYVLRINPNGGISGKTYAPGDSSGKTWRPAVECAATVDDHLKWRADWFAEFSLPLESFGEPLTDQWRVNWGGWGQGCIPRMRSGAKAYAYAWHTTGSERGTTRFHYDPRYYGRIKLTR